MPDMRVRATQAKNRFRAMCTQAKTEPVFVEKDDVTDDLSAHAPMMQQHQRVISLLSRFIEN